jgi:uncharacterized protein (TIGR00369 family)
MPSPSIEERYNPKIAEGFVRNGGRGGGGALPEVLGITLTKSEPGKMWATAEITEDLLTPFGNVHGGAFGLMLDHVTGTVVYPLMEPGYWAATTELKINYIAPMQAGTVTIEATVLAMTNRSAVVRGEVYNGEKLLAAAQGTLTIVAPRS